MDRQVDITMNQIYRCKRCNLCKNQKPLLDSERKCQVFWVGLSAKKIKNAEKIPLSPNTNTGMLIKKIEDKCQGITTYKTNLVKCPPLTEQQKLRYPNKNEIDTCFSNLITEINRMSPKIVFLLGEKVYSSVGRHLNVNFEKWSEFEYHYRKLNGIYYVPIHHPSYIYVYKRNQIDNYVNSISRIIHELL